jgi:nucleotide-binding universal stress UspA family protein
VESVKAMKILIPVDGSDSANRAIEHVIRQTKGQTGVDIHVLNVQIPVLSGHAKMFISEQQLNDYYREEANAALKSVLERLTQAHVAHSHHINVGHIAETIAQYAKENQVDQIVMGTRGMGAISDFVLGSIATKVIHLSSVPVTLIK